MHGIARFDSVQPRYNLLFRENERELFPLCAEEQVAVIPYNPLAGGLLTGKHRPGAPTEGTRFTLGRAQDMYRERLDSIRGMVPDPYHRPTGCSFHTRCDFAMAQASEERQV